MAKSFVCQLVDLRAAWCRLLHLFIASHYIHQMMLFPSHHVALQNPIQQMRAPHALGPFMSAGKFCRFFFQGLFASTFCAFGSISSHLILFRHGYIACLYIQKYINDNFLFWYCLYLVSFGSCKLPNFIIDCSLLMCLSFSLSFELRCGISSFIEIFRPPNSSPGCKIRSNNNTLNHKHTHTQTHTPQLYIVHAPQA